jgi:CBS domain-containing protein
MLVTKFDSLLSEQAYYGGLLHNFSEGCVMDHCARCGQEVDKTLMNFCPKCGEPLQKIKNEEFTVSSDDLVSEVKKLIHEGNVRRIVVKDEKGNNLLDIPVTFGVIGIIIAPWIAALGVIAAMVTKAKIVVEKRQ